MKHQELDLPLLLMLKKTATSTKLQEQDKNLKKTVAASRSVRRTSVVTAA